MFDPNSYWNITIANEPALIRNDKTVNRKVNHTYIAFLAKLGRIF